jgi:SpoIID/LytB domain protein
MPSAGVGKLRFVRTLRASAIAAALLLGAAAHAGAAIPDWVIKGRGFGHGAGMSQYGAYGYARHGKGYPFILGHYYRGTQVGTVSPRTVRVLLHIGHGDVGFSGASSACGRNLDPGRGYRAHRSGSAVTLLGEDGNQLAGCGAKLRAEGSGGQVRISSAGRYRGALEVVPTRSDAGSLNVINALAVNRYVQGVIAGEMPSGWPMAALRAQAVAARSYALSSGVGGNGFDLYDDTRSQVYEGIDGETARTNAAAQGTANEVVLYNGRIAQTFFFSSSGGQTENVEFAFIGTDPVPYLKSVKDPYDGLSPLHSWMLRIPHATMQSRLARYVSGRLRRIEVPKRGVSPRIVRARLVGSTGTTTIRGDTLQHALGLYGRWAYFSRAGGGQGTQPPVPGGAQQPAPGGAQPPPAGGTQPSA